MAELRDCLRLPLVRSSFERTKGGRELTGNLPEIGMLASAERFGRFFFGADDELLSLSSTDFLRFFAGSSMLYRMPRSVYCWIAMKS